MNSLSKNQAWAVIAVLAGLILLIGVAIQQQLAGRSQPSFEEEVMVYGLEVNGTAKAYPEKYLIQQLSFTEEVNGQSIRMINDEGKVIFQDTASRQDLPTTKTTLKEWQQQHPDTLLY